MLDLNQRELSFPVYKTGAIDHYANQASVVPMGLEPILPGGLVSRTSVYANSTKGPKVEPHAVLESAYPAYEADASPYMLMRRKITCPNSIGCSAIYLLVRTFCGFDENRTHIKSLGNSYSIH